MYSIKTNAQNNVETIVEQYTDVFRGFGVLPYTYKIQLKYDAQPVIHAPRRVPAPLREKLKQKKNIARLGCGYLARIGIG